jgi:hypothetical protein
MTRPDLTDFRKFFFGFLFCMALVYALGISVQGLCVVEWFLRVYESLVASAGCLRLSHSVT